MMCLHARTQTQMKMPSFPAKLAPRLRKEACALLHLTATQLERLQRSGPTPASRDSGQGCSFGFFPSVQPLHGLLGQSASLGLVAKKRDRACSAAQAPNISSTPKSYLQSGLNVICTAEKNEKMAESSNCKNAGQSNAK